MLKLFTLRWRGGQIKTRRYGRRAMKAYEEILKVYRDNYSVIETAKEEGKNEGMVNVAKEMKKDGHPIEMTSKYTGLTREQIEKL